MGLSPDIFRDKRLASHLRTSEEVRSLLKTIDRLPLYIGAEPFGNMELPVIMIANFIMKKYPGFMAEQVVDAFESAAVGELFLDNRRVNITTYKQGINIELVGHVLTAWRDYVRAEKMRPKMIPPNRQLEEHRDVPDNKWHYDSLLLEIEKRGEIPMFRPWRLIHSHLVAIGELGPIKSEQRGKAGSIAEKLFYDQFKKAVEKYLRKLK